MRNVSSGGSLVFFCFYRILDGLDVLRCLQLKERLFRAKGEWQDELIARREAVKDRRQRKKDLVNCAQKTIDEYRRVSKLSSTALSKPTSGDLHSKIYKTPKLEALRRKLEERRTSRYHKMHSEGANVIFKSKSSQSSALIADGICDNSKNTTLS